jgi:hypothetical protein
MVFMIPPLKKKGPVGVWHKQRTPQRLRYRNNSAILRRRNIRQSADGKHFAGRKVSRGERQAGEPLATRAAASLPALRAVLSRLS